MGKIQLPQLLPPCLFARPPAQFKKILAVFNFNHPKNAIDATGICRSTFIRHAPVMAADTNTTLNNLAYLIQAIARDPKLFQWFCALAKKSAVERRNEIFAATKRMTEQGEDPKIISSLFLLTEEKIFDAALRSLREPGHIKE
jgi:hypothetical protein